MNQFMISSVKNILLKGYYGFGNLGDDILMLSVYSLLKERFPDANFHLFTFSENAEYIARLQPQIKQVRSHHISYDLIVHGGGGVYFDFKSGNWKNLLVNRMAGVIGIKNHSRALKSYYKLKGISTERGNLRVGLGIGVGTYTPSSKKLSSNLISISDYDWLMVRDQKSANNFRKISAHSKLIVGTDLAFADRFCSSQPSKKTGAPKIALIIRETDHKTLNKDLIDQLETRSEEFQIFIFDSRADESLIVQLKNRKNLIVWDPEQQSVEAYIQHLKKMDLIITSRAHGAIIGSMLSIPSIILKIEPKLETVHHMFPGSSEIICLDEIESMLNKKIDICLKELEQRKALLDKEVDMNKRKLEDSLKLFDAFLNSQK